MANLTETSSDKRKDSMAAVAIQRAPALPHQHFQPIIENPTTQRATRDVVKFDPKKHLNYSPPAQIIKMKDIGYSEDQGISPVAVSQPFQLFTSEAIQQMRSEIFSKEVRENCEFSSNIAACQLRGYARDYAPFAYDAWNHPETLALISKIAGIDLVPVGDYEIGHINLSVKSEEQTKEELAVINKQKRFFADDEGIGGCPWEDDKPIVGWHTDSYPFVCVLMMSDCSNMVGGETALRTKHGEVIKVRGPQEGCAVVLQGRYITHQALRALGAKERITSVTSFRPRSPYVKEDSVLNTVRPISDLSELYYDFAEYRCEILEERLRKERKEISVRRKARKKFDTVAHKEFLESSIAFLEHTNKEMLEDSKVIPGFIEEMNIPDVVVSDTNDERATKRARVE